MTIEKQVAEQLRKIAPILVELAEILENDSMAKSLNTKEAKK